MIISFLPNYFSRTFCILWDFKVSLQIFYTCFRGILSKFKLYLSKRHIEKIVCILINMFNCLNKPFLQLKSQTEWNNAFRSLKLLTFERPITEFVWTFCYIKTNLTPKWSRVSRKKEAGNRDILDDTY